jgi:hypothetical protein
MVNVCGVMSVSILLPQHAVSAELEKSFGKSAISVIGRHVYVAWHTNDMVNGNEEVHGKTIQTDQKIT